MNRFGSASQKFPLYDPRCARASRVRFRRDAIPALGRANSLYVPGGRWPARGWLLLARADYDLLDRYSVDLELEVGDPRLTDNVGTIKGLAVVQAQCVTRGLASDKSALYLVEVTDVRGVLHNRWFSAPLLRRYNVRAPAYPDTYYSDSLNSGSTWTWSTMTQNLWAQMPLLGTWPGLPSAPTGSPEGWWFNGTSAWTSLCDVLDHLGMIVAVDLTSSTPYDIVSMGADDSSFSDLQGRYAGRLEDDQEWIDVGAGRVPKTVTVYFRRRNEVYGTEETVRYDSLQWSTSAVYSVTVNAPATFSSAVGTHHLWSDFTVRHDMDGTLNAADVISATAIAQERVTQYFDRIYSRTSGYMSRTYAGALPFATGSQIDGVCWYQDYEHQERQGWKTAIVRGGYPPWPELVFPQGS